MNFVLDTSVVVKWFSKVSEDGLHNALKVRENYLNKRIFLLFPDLLFYELINVLRYKPGFGKQEVKEALESLNLMKIEVVPFSQKVGDISVEVALKYDIAVYDAYFIALAEKVNYKLITADEKCYKKVRNLSWVMWIGDF